MDLSVIKLNLFEFYSTTEESRRQVLNEWLTKALDSSDSWKFSWQILNPTEELYVQLFAVNCIYHNLTTKFREIVASSTSEFDELRELLINLCTNVPNAAVKSKLSSCLAVFILQTVPDIWSDPVEMLFERWANSNSSVLMEVFADLVVEFRKLCQPLDRRNIVRSILRQNEPLVANCAAQMLQSSSNDSNLAETCIHCIETWIEFDGANLSDWQQIIVLCLSKIQSSPDLISIVSKFFQNFVENSELYRMESFVAQLYDYASNLVSILHKIDREEELYENLSKMIVALATNQTKILLKLLKHNSTAASTIIDFLLSLSSLPGCYPTEEMLSSLPVTFWYNLQEETTVVEDKEVLNLNLTFVRPFYVRLFTSLPSKIQYPKEDVFSAWSKDDKERFEAYRIDISDTLTCCYRIIGASMTEHLLNLAKNSFSLISDTNWQPFESILFVYESIGEYITVQNHFVRQFFTDVCFRTPANLHNPTLSNTLLRTFSKYNHIINDGELIPKYTDLVLQFLNDPTCVTNATLALRDLCSTRHSCLKNLQDSVVYSARKCFETSNFSDHDRLQALSCVGFVLSLQSSVVILQNLNDLLAPRLEKLQRFNNNNASYGSKEELLFEFDVVSTLIGSLSANEDDVQQPKPAYLVISQSLDLFKAIYASSRGDLEVAAKLCHTLKCGIVSLLDDLKDLVPKYCELILFMYDRPERSCVLDLTKTLFLMFFNDEPLQNMLANVFNRLLQNTISFGSPQAVDSCEEFLKLCYSLSKKCWKFFSSPDVGCDTVNAVHLACRCLGFNDSTTVKEAALFLCEFLKHSESDVVNRIVADYGGPLIQACFERLKVEILTSCLEYIADVMFILSSHYTQYLLTWRQLLPEHPLVAAMMKEIGNKRKFREFAKQINIGCRKNAFIL